MPEKRVRAVLVLGLLSMTSCVVFGASESVAADGGGVGACNERAAGDAAVEAAACTAEGSSVARTAPEASVCNTLPSEVALAVRGEVHVVTLEFATADPRPALSQSGSCPIDVAGKETSPTRAFVVVNATTAPAKLSAWGFCRVGNEALFMAFYGGTKVPSTTLEMGRCRGSAAATYESPSSPESGGSGWCKSLVGAYALNLAPCERVVVLFQHPDIFPDVLGPAAGKLRLD